METRSSIDAAAVTPPVPAASESAPRWAQLRWMGRNRKVVFGGLLLLAFAAIGFLAPILAPHAPSDFVSRPHQAPSAEHWLGTTGQGQDVLSQLIWGTRISLGIGVLTGLLTTLIGVTVGLTAGYLGGRVDDALSLMTNVVLIIPSLPLLVTLAAFLPPGPITILLVLAATGWAWPARVLRSQVLSLREKDFIAAAQVTGEGRLRIIFREILPNMVSLVAASFIGSTTYAIGAEAALEFLGLGNVSLVSWGTMLFWAQNNSALLTGAWWTFVPPGVCIALVAFSCSMMNFAVDEITNPRLRAEKEIAHVIRKLPAQDRGITPVVRKS